MNSVPFRIKVGITGHRKNLPDTTLLKNKIRQVLGIDEWNKNRVYAPSSIFSLFDEQSIRLLHKAKNTNLAFSVMTALAEGADRIAAEAILEIEGTRLEPVLPLSKEDFLEDFKTVESKKEFEELLKKGISAITLRSKNIDDEFEFSERSIARKRAYFNAGKHIVENCDFLLAFWNGNEESGNSGTFEVIQYARKLKRPLIIINTVDPESIIIEKGNFISAAAISHIEHFNSFKVSETEINEYIKNVFNEYFNDPDLPESKNFNPAILESLKEKLIPYYTKASLLAKSFKNQYKWAGHLTYLCSVSAVIILLISVVFNIFMNAAFLIEFFLLAFIFIIISIAHKRKVHSGWLEYRFLVERIRAAPYFFLANREVLGVTSHSNSGQTTKRGQWVVMVFSEIWYHLILSHQKKKHEQQSPEPFNKELIFYVKKSWIEGQIKFQKKYFKRNHLKNRFLEKGGRIIFATALAAALMHIILSWFPDDSEQSHLIHNLLIIFALSLPTIAAAFEGVRRQSEYSRNKNRSESMIYSLQELNNKYETVVDENEFYKLLRETDKLMLSETQEWIMLMIPSELDYVT